MCISKQAVYKIVRRVDLFYEQTENLQNLIMEIRNDHPTMGVRDMYFKINPTFMGRDAFERYCMRNNFMVKKIKNYARTTDSSGVKRFDNLLEGLVITRCNQVLQSDITYFEVDGTFYYITFVIDAFSRRIVGYSVSNTLLTIETTIPALNMAIRCKKGQSMKGLIFHSDGGGQYYCKEFLKITQKNGIRNSMCVDPWENGKAERINGVIKNNYLIHRDIQSYDALTKEVARAVRLYNYEKPHIKLNRLTPIAFENLLLLQDQEKNSDILNCKNQNEQGHQVPSHFTKKKAAHIYLQKTESILKMNQLN
jgi:putative transposase